VADYTPFGSGASGDESETNSARDSAVSPGFLAGIGGDSGGDSGGNGRDVNGDEFDPTIHAGRDKLNRDGSYRKKRGRKPGSTAAGRNQGKAGYQANIESLSSILAIVHAGLASATKTPEVALESDEADALAKASAQVLIEFDITPNPKVQAIVGLVMCCGSIYGPRVYLVRERWKEEKENG
jgi:hypothetical protein